VGTCGQSPDRERPGRARALIEAYNQGDAEAGAAIGVLYLNGITYPRDLAKARSYLEWARGKGSGWASAVLALIYLNGYGVPADPKRGFSLLEEAGSRGYPGGRALQALNAYVEAHSTGEFNTEAVASAARRAVETAKTGDPISLSVLARFYLVGVPTAGVPQDWAKARTLWEEAMDKGYLLAGSFLVPMYYYGYGGPADQAKAIALAKQLVGMGPQPTSFLATAYYFGVAGEPKDPKKACDLASQSRVHAQGMAIYALCLLDGHLPGGRAQGYAWLLRAAAGGNDLAKSLAPEWEKRLTKEEIDEAKRLLPNLK